MRAEKKRLTGLLRESDFQGIIDLGLQGVPVFRILQGLSYDKTDVVCWRAVEAVGRFAAAIAANDPGAVRNMVRRLVWTLSDECGGMAWSAPEMLAEIAARTPLLCRDIPLIVIHLDEPPFRTGAIWAAGRLAETHREDALTAVPDLLETLDDADAALRGTAVWALGRLQIRGAWDAIKNRRDDPGTLRLYRDGELGAYCVGDLANEALLRIDGG